MTSQALDRMYSVRKAVTKTLVERIFGRADDEYNPFSQGVCRSSEPAIAAGDHGLVSFKLICGSKQKEIALYLLGGFKIFLFSPIPVGLLFD